MGAAAPRETPPRGGALMSIGEVLSRLRPEFPDITISKLRFLEAEGLIDPLRAPSGYRKFTAAHVEQLRFVLAAQRDRYLPLRVIREHLANPASTVTAPEVSPREASASDSTNLTRAKLREESGLDENGLVDLEEYGLLPAPTNGLYGAEALTVARVAAQLAEYGLEARHLRPYRTMADREVGLLAQLVPLLSHQAGPGGRRKALATVHELAALCTELHGALVRQGLRDSVGT
jgi:DNA-binding transcriptional MerR regulator